MRGFSDSDNYYGISVDKKFSYFINSRCFSISQCFYLMSLHKTVDLNGTAFVVLKAFHCGLKNGFGQAALNLSEACQTI